MPRLRNRVLPTYALCTFTEWCKYSVILHVGSPGIGGNFSCTFVLREHSTTALQAPLIVTGSLLQFLKILFLRMQLGYLSHYSDYSRGSATERFLFDSLQGKEIDLFWNRPWRILEPTKLFFSGHLRFFRGGVKVAAAWSWLLTCIWCKVKNAWNCTSTILYAFISWSFFTCYPSLTLKVLMSYIYGAPILDVSRSHTTTQHSR